MDYYERKFRNSGSALKMCWYCFIGIVIVLFLSALFSGCKSIEYVPMKETRIEHHHTTDTIHTTDSIIDKQTTVIREVDSATMAQYGIKLNAAERAWLIQNDRLQREIERLQAIHSEADSVEDEKPVPVPVEKKLTAWQQVCIDYGKLTMGATVLLVIFIIIWIVRRFRKTS